MRDMDVFGRTALSVVIAVFLAGATAVPAYADWEWTRWRMSRADFESAARSKNASVKEAPWSTPDFVELVGPYKAFDLDLNALYKFDGELGLRQVVLTPQGRAGCNALAAAAAKRYGAPASESATATAKRAQWRDEAGGTSVRLEVLGPADRPEECQLMFEQPETRAAAPKR